MNLEQFFKLFGQGTQQGSEGVQLNMRAKNYLANMLAGKQAEQEFEKPFKEGNLAVAKQQADTNERYRRDVVDIQDKQIRAGLLEKMLAGAKPLTGEQEKTQLLSQEGLDATDRTIRDSVANPGAAKAVQWAERARSSIPFAGGIIGDSISGVANLFNPAAGRIDADREKIARNQLYLKSGAASGDKEVAGTRRQLPGVTTSAQDATQRYQEFAAPFRQTKAMHERYQPSEADLAAAQGYVDKGGSIPRLGIRSQAPAPQAPLTKTVGGVTYTKTARGWESQ